MTNVTEVIVIPALAGMTVFVKSISRHHYGVMLLIKSLIIDSNKFTPCESYFLLFIFINNQITIFMALSY